MSKLSSLPRLSCRHAQRQLSRLRDHAEETPEASVQAHLAQCDTCRRFAQAMQITLPQPIRPGADGTLVDRALQAWQQEAAPPLFRMPSPWLYPGVALSAAGIIVACFWLREQTAPAPIVGNNAIHSQIAGGKGAVPSKTAKAVPVAAHATAPQAAVMPRYRQSGGGESTAVIPVDKVAVQPQASAKKNAPLPPKPLQLGVPRKASQKAPVDDLAFINQNPTDALNAWSGMAPDEQMRLEQQIRSSLKQGDDFVQVPFPRLASLGDRRAVQDALASFRQEASVVDARLQRAVSLSAKQVPFAQFCETLTQQTGITFAADASVADDNIVLFCTDCNLRDVMRQISRHFGFTWRREGSRGNYRYTISQELPAQIAEEELRNRDRSQAILALDTEMQQFRPYLHLTPEQIIEKYIADRERYHAFGKQWSESTEAQRKQLTKEGKGYDTLAPELDKRLNFWEKLGGQHWVPIHLYFQLTPDQRAALARGVELRFASLPQDADFRLAPLMEKRLRETLRGTYYTFSKQNAQHSNYWQTNFMPISVSSIALSRMPGFKSFRDAVPPDDPASDRYHVTPLTAPPGTIAVSASLSIQQREPGIFTLDGGAGTSRVQNGKPNGGGGSSGALVTGISPSVRKPVSRPWEGTAAETRQQVSAQTVRRATFASPYQYRTSPLRLEDDGSLSKADSPRIGVADVWEQLHRATKQNILSDGFSHLIWPDDLPAVNGKSLPEALDTICPLLGQRWRVTAGESGKPWVLARSASFFNDRTREVPKRLFEEWAKRRQERGYATIELLAEMANLSDAQLSSKDMRETAVAVYGLREWEMASTSNFRKEWRFYNTLTEEQQRKIWTREGLLFRELTQEQQDLVLKQHYSGGLPQSQRNLYVEGGRITAKYTPLPEAMQVKRDSQGKPWSYSQDPQKPYYEPRIVWVFGYDVTGQGQSGVYSYAP